MGEVLIVLVIIAGVLGLAVGIPWIIDLIGAGNALAVLFSAYALVIIIAIVGYIRSARKIAALDSDKPA